MKSVTVVVFLIYISSCTLLNNHHDKVLYRKYKKMINGNEKELFVDRKEALNSWQYLNNLRSSKDSILKYTQLELPNYKNTKPLIWNETLEKVAILKAEDMAQRNYFKHKTPEGYGINFLIYQEGFKLPESEVLYKGSNYYESLGAGYLDYKDLINSLIIDEGEPSKGHRKHLLGMSDYYVATEVGIAFVRSINNDCSYSSYCCIIIAPNYNN